MFSALVPTKVKTLLGFLSVLTLGLSAQQSQAADTLWIAKLTGRVQCQETARASLSDAIKEVESSHTLVVQQAKVARLRDQSFCSGCQCPVGTYFVVEIQKASGQALNLGSQWQVIDPKNLAAPRVQASVSGEDRSIDPVLPTY